MFHFGDFLTIKLLRGYPSIDDATPCILTVLLLRYDEVPRQVSF